MPHIPSVASSPTEQQSPSSAVHHQANEEYKEEYEACFDDYISDSDIPDDLIAPASAEVEVLTSVPSFTSQGLPSIGLLAPSLTEAGRQHYAEASLFGRKKQQQQQQQHHISNSNNRKHNNTSKNTIKHAHAPTNTHSSVHITPISITSSIPSTPSLPIPQHTFLGIHMIKADPPTSSTSPSPSAITCDQLQVWLISTDTTSTSADPTSSLYLRACLIHEPSSYIHIWIHPHEIHQVHVIRSYRIRILDIIKINSGNNHAATSTPDIRVYVAVDKLTSPVTSPAADALLSCVTPATSRHLTLSTSLIAPSHITCARSLTDYHDSLEIQLSCRAVQHDKSIGIPNTSSTSTSQSQSQPQSQSQAQPTDVSALPSSFSWLVELSIMRLYGTVEAHAMLNASQLHAVHRSPIQCRVADHVIILHTVQTDAQVTWTSEQITSCGPFLDISLGITIHRDATSPIQSQPSSTHLLVSDDDTSNVHVDPGQLSAALDALFDYHSDSDEEK